METRTTNSFVKAKKELELYKLKITEVRILSEKITKLEREINTAGGSAISIPEGGNLNSISSKIAYLADMKNNLNDKLHDAETYLLLIDNKISKLSKEHSHYLTMRYIILSSPVEIARQDCYSPGHVRRKILEAVHEYAKLYFPE